MSGALQHNSFGDPDYRKFSDGGSAREQALADHGDRMRCSPCMRAAAEAWALQRRWTRGATRNPM